MEIDANTQSYIDLFASKPHYIEVILSLHV